MADIDLVTANRVSLVKGGFGDGHLLPPGVAGEAIVAGAPVYRDATTGKYLNSDGNASPKDTVLGIALRTVITGEPLTAAYGKAIIDGYDLTALDYHAPVYLSNTVGRLGTTAGSTSVIVGRVVPGLATSVGVSPDKLLGLDL